MSPIRSTVLLSIAGFLIAHSALAQEYKTIPITARDSKTKETIKLDARGIKKQLSKLREPINKMKFGQFSLDDTAKKQIDQYYLRNFALMTQEDGHGDAAKVRQTMLNEIRKLKKADHDYLVARLYYFCNKLIPHNEKMNYHPVVRFNCMLIMAHLNQVEIKGSSSDAVPEVPLRQARTFMLAQYKDPNQIDAVRLGALIGLQRHAEISRYGNSAARAISDGDKAEITKICMDLLSSAEPTNGRAESAHDWFQRRAAQILGSLGDAGTDGAVAKLLDATVREKSKTLGLRCECSNSLGRITYAKPVALKADLAAGGMGYVAVDAIGSEVDRIEKVLEQQVAGSPGGYGGVPGGAVGGGGYDAYEGGAGAGAAASDYGEGPTGGYPYGGGGQYPYGGGDGGRTPRQVEPPEDPAITLVRRQLKHQLNCVTVGLIGDVPKKAGGMLSIAQGQEQTAVKNIARSVNEILKSLDEKNLRLDKLKDELKDLSAKLERACAAVVASRT